VRSPVAAWANERTSGNGPIALWLHIQRLRGAVPECER
jgi:hypothetical protein